MTGCTYGKGNLIHLDYGKHAYTFIRRSDGKAIRITSRPDAWGKPDPEHQKLRTKVTRKEATDEEEKQFKKELLERAYAILDRPSEELFTITPVSLEMPAKARFNDSLTCDSCGEFVMESRSRLFQGQQLCIPCFEQQDRRF